jgi:hypothetical protein
MSDTVAAAPQRVEVDYLARIELHGDRTKEDYIWLQTEVAKAKFYTTIVGGTGGTSFHLPSGTYYYYGNLPQR